MSALDRAALDGVRALLLAVGEDPDREGLRDTPRRVLAALREMSAGLGEDAAAVLGTTFEADGYDQVVVLRDVAFASLCEHHLLPFVGRAHVGYLPGARVVGLSKLARLVEAHARRPQIQERMTRDIALDIERVLCARGVAVVVEASHECMACRGVRKAGATMVTSEMLGRFRDTPAARAEVLSLMRG